MSTRKTDGQPYLLVAPQRFPDLERESEIAAGAGLRLVATETVADFQNRLPQASAVLIGTQGSIDEDALRDMSVCVGVVRYGVGVDNVDVTASTAAGIPVANVPDAATEEVASHAVALALSLLRRIVETDTAMHAGVWSPEPMTGTRRLSQLTVGVIGGGRIGEAAATMFTGLGAKVVVNDQHAVPAGFESVTFEEVLERADVISLHLPLTAHTRHLISADTIASMQRGVVLINVSRGSLIDEDAAAAALYEGQLGGLGLDVFETEPLPPEHALLGTPRTILTPHVAWRSSEAVAEYQEKACEQIALALQGQRMSTVLNPEAYDAGDPALARS